MKLQLSILRFHPIKLLTMQLQLIKTSTTNQVFKRALVTCIGFIFIAKTIFFTFSNSVSAQTGFSITVSPPTSYIKLKPASSGSHTIRLTNTSSETVTIMPRVFSSEPDKNSSYPVLQNNLSFPYLNENENQLKPITIAPGQTSSYSLQFVVPPDAPSKEYPLTILFSKVLDSGSQSVAQFTQSRVYGAVASNIVVLISDVDTLTNNLKVINVETPVIVDSLRKLRFSPNLFNHGIQAVMASGSATITNQITKNVVYTAELYPDVVLGGQQREARALIPGSGNQPPEPTSFSYDPPLLVGKYSISVRVFDESGNTLSLITKDVIALPYSVAFGMLFSGLIWYGSKVLLSKSVRPESNGA